RAICASVNQKRLLIGQSPCGARITPRANDQWVLTRVSGETGARPVSVSSPLLGGYDEPETLRYEIKSNVPRVLTGDSLDVGQLPPRLPAPCCLTPLSGATRFTVAARSGFGVAGSLGRSGA